MQPDALTVPAIVTPGADADAWAWLRQALPVAFLVIGGLVTLWILLQLGPVAYGLPAPFFRRPPIGG
jgi:hypothetical protein